MRSNSLSIPCLLLDVLRSILILCHRYGDKVVADNFRFGDDSDIVRVTQVWICVLRLILSFAFIIGGCVG